MTPPAATTALTLTAMQDGMPSSTSLFNSQANNTNNNQLSCELSYKLILQQMIDMNIVGRKSVCLWYAYQDFLL